jgi:Flp pilus assembly protein TadD
MRRWPDVVRIASLRGAALAFALSFSLAVRAGYSFDAPPAHPDWEPGLEALQRDDWTEARERFAQVVRNEPGNADARAMLGYACQRSGDMKVAIQAYDAALELSPNHRFALRHAGEARLMGGDRRGAEQYLARLVTACGSQCEDAVALRALLERTR